MKPKKTKQNKKDNEDNNKEYISQYLVTKNSIPNKNHKLFQKPCSMITYKVRTMYFLNKT